MDLPQTMEALTLTTKQTVPASSGGVVPEAVESAVERLVYLPELVEVILDNLHFSDLFSAAAVCRTWKSIFDQSAALQAKTRVNINDLELNGYKEEFDEKLGLSVIAKPDLRNPSRFDGIDFTLSFTFKEHVPIQLTNNLRKCLATQPACTRTEIRLNCCLFWQHHIEHEAGITIGDVVDAARRVYAEHGCDCPEAQSKQYSPHSYPYFQGRVWYPNGWYPIGDYLNKVWVWHPDENGRRGTKAVVRNYGINSASYGTTTTWLPK